MAVLLGLAPVPATSTTVKVGKRLSSNLRNRRGVVKFARTMAFFNPFEDPIVKEAVKEPVAFVGGMFAGILRLDLNEDPLREWISKTVEASGLAKKRVLDGEEPKVEAEEDAPQQIEIE